MANFSDTLSIILANEGGYTCAFSGSGETYRGIDRNYSNNWGGWVIVDNAKATGKLDAKCKKFGQIINNPQLNGLVNGWYSQQLLPYFQNFENIQNQTLANFVADFMWHKPFRCIPIVNEIAKQLNPNVVVENNRITNSVIATMNKNYRTFYNRLRLKRIDYYNNPRSLNSNWNEKFIKTKNGLLNRIAKFPRFLV